MKNLALAWRWLRRDLAAGELGIIALALVVAVAAMCSVGFFTDRVQQALDSEANQMLAADMVVSSDHPIAPAFTEQIALHGMRGGAITSFPSMVIAGEQTQMAALKAVSSSYPLRGKLVIQRGQTEVAVGAPPPGQAWADQRLFDALGLKPGASIEVGATRLTLAAVLVREPDAALDVFNVVPRLMFNQADLAATGLIQRGSRIRYRLLAAGDPQQVDALRGWMQPKLDRGQRLEDVREARPELRTALERAGRFLHLSALMGVFLAAAAMSLAARRYVERQLNTVALLRTLGQSQRRIMALFLQQYLMMGLLAISTGVALGWLAQFALSQTLGSLFDATLPAAGWLPGLAGALVGLVLLLGFCLPPLLRLSGVPPLRVLRRDTTPAGNALLTGSLGAMALAGLIAWQAGEFKLAALALGGFSAALLLALLAAWLLVWLVPKLPLPGSAGWRFGLANVARRRGLSVAQVVALSIGMMALLLLTVVRNDLLGAWQRSLPADAPNRFVINIQPEQRAPLAEAFRSAGLPVPAFEPMIRARLMSIDGRAVSADRYSDDNAKRLAEREFNLSWGAPPRNDNRVIAGQALDQDQPGWAVEAELAKTLGIKLGDNLIFDIAGSRYTAPVLALRKVSWDSFRVNFFVVGTRALLEKQPASYVTSFHLDEQHASFANRLARDFNNVTVVDVSTIVGEVRKVLERVMTAVEVVFAFSLAAGLVVLYAATLATHDERKQEVAILRTLGASRALVNQAVSAELLLIGGFAGLLAASAALAMGALTARLLFNLPVQPSWWLLPVGLFGGGLAARLAASPLLRRALQTAPLRALA
ncbi:ABC transporter permease [Chitinimonas sp.]|uniref:ABC transporter permease n=1 Tax=Chitinimonas sp. TaxID=1934313 RepID=UPI0035B3EE9B